MMTDRLIEKNPLVHLLMHDMVKDVCVNACLIAGAKALAADNPDEVAELTETADVVYGNLGSQTKDRMQAMRIAREKAYRRGAPFVLDVSGVAASAARRRQVREFAEIAKIDVLKGNQAEILALALEQDTARGVDAEMNHEKQALEAALQLTKNTASVVVVSGATDLITDGKDLSRVELGDPAMQLVTGTGCIGSLLCAIYAAIDPMKGAIVGMRLNGAAGAETIKRVNASFGIGFYYPVFLSVLEEVIRGKKYAFGERHV